MENQSLQLGLKSNFFLDFNLDGAFDLKTVPKKYIDLIDEPIVQEYLDLAEKLRADTILFIEEESKKIEQIKAVINDVNTSFEQLSQNTNNRITVSEIQVFQNHEDLEKFKALELKRLNKLLWFFLSYKINLEWRIDELGYFRQQDHDFNKDNLLRYFKLIDKNLSAECTEKIYERFAPYLNYEVLETGDVVLSLNPDIKRLCGNGRSGYKERNYIINRYDFFWLINFILFNCDTYRFNSDRLSEVNYKIILNRPNEKDSQSTRDENFQKFGIELSITESGYRIMISKEHIPLLEQKINFNIVIPPPVQRKTFKSLVLGFLNWK